MNNLSEVIFSFPKWGKIAFGIIGVVFSSILAYGQSVEEKMNAAFVDWYQTQSLLKNSPVISRISYGNEYGMTRVDIEINNCHRSKTIKYFYIWVKGNNAVSDLVFAPKKLTLIGPVAPKCENGSYSFDRVAYDPNESVNSISITKASVLYMDGTTHTWVGNRSALYGCGLWNKEGEDNCAFQFYQTLQGKIWASRLDSLSKAKEKQAWSIGHEEKVYEFVEQVPEYEGGNVAMLEFIKSNLIYPELAKQNKIQGNVFLRFTVSENGLISDIEIARSLGNGCDEEAIRLVKLMPKWRAGRQYGANVKVKHTIVVSFDLPK